MMRKLFFALFLIICSGSIAQNFDSLVYASVKLDTDTERVNIYYKQGFKARTLAPQFAYNCAKQAEFFGQQSRSPKHLAKAYNLLGVLYYRKGDLKKALTYHEKALEIREKVKDKAGIAKSETNLGNVYSDLHKSGLAERSYMHALQINNELGDQKQTANCYINIGVLKISDKKYKDAEKYFLDAYKLAKSTMDYEVEAMCLNNLSVINFEEKNYETAIGNCLDAIKVNEIMGNEMDKTDSYINLARNYFKLNDLANCENCIRKADSLCSVFGYVDARCHLLLLKSGIAETSDPSLSLLRYKQYMTLKDSIENENKKITLSNDFSEDRIERFEAGMQFNFPYLMLAGLMLFSFAGTFIIYRNKR
jgi:tetratricopeptide (TPR) repeat protein